MFQGWYARRFGDRTNVVGPPHTPSPSNRVNNVAKKNVPTLQVPERLVVVRMLDQLYRNAIVMWSTSVDNGLLPQGGLGLTVTQIKRKLWRCFRVEVPFSTPQANLSAYR